MALLKVSGLSIVEAPVSFGQDFNGVAKAPKVFEECGLHKLLKSLDWKINDISTVDVAFSLNLAKLTYDPVLFYTEKEIFNCYSLGVVLNRVHDAVVKRARCGDFVLTLGGDHSVAAASISAMLEVHKDLCVVWVDAHGDINTPETSDSHKYHGMPIAHLLKDRFTKRVPGFEWIEAAPALPKDRIGLIGLRQLDKGETQLISDCKITALSMKEVDELQIKGAVQMILQAIDPRNERPIHLSFDIDACDPLFAPGTGTKARGGLTYREAHYICEVVSKTGRLVSMDMVEVNPDIDEPDMPLHGDNENIAVHATKTVRLALELISSALGKTILL